MNRNKEFFKYVIPTIISFTLTGIYSIVDGFFVGNSIGDIGLSSINIAYPISALIQALGIGIGMGGSVRYSIEKAENNNEKAKAFIGGTMQLLAIVSLLCTILLYVFSEPLLRLLGAEGEVLTQGKTYIDVIVLGSFLQIFSTAFIPLIRNLGGAYFSIITMILGFTSNIVFDYILMFPFGMDMPGAALATALSPVVGILICQLHFRSKKCTVSFLPVIPSLKRLIFSCQVGVSAFVGEISSGVITTAFNLIILRLAGNTGVAAYGVVANISLVAVALFNGISQGSQPLLSSFYGQADKKALEKVIGLSLRTAAVTAVCIYAVIYLWSEPIAGIFNQEHNEELAAMARFGLKLYFIGFFFAGINIVGTGILSAVESVKWAFTASISRGFVMILLSAFTMSAVWGMTGIWLAFPAAEFITMGMTLAGIWGFFSKVNLVGKSL